MSNILSGYLANALTTTKRRKIVDTLAEELGGLPGKFVIAFSGMSGALVAPAVADKIKCPIVLIRKESDRLHSHSSLQWEGERNISRYVIIDDFVTSGKTIERIKNKMESRSQDSELIAIVTYDQDMYGCRDNAQKFNCPALTLTCNYKKVKWCYPK